MYCSGGLGLLSAHAIPAVDTCAVPPRRDGVKLTASLGARFYDYRTPNAPLPPLAPMLGYGETYTAPIHVVARAFSPPNLLLQLQVQGSLFITQEPEPMTSAD